LKNIVNKAANFYNQRAIHLPHNMHECARDSTPRLVHMSYVIKVIVHCYGFSLSLLQQRDYERFSFDIKVKTRFVVSE